MGLFCTDSLCVLQGQGGTAGSVDGSVQYEGGTWWSVGSVAGDASGYQMVDHVLVSTSDYTAA